MGQGRVRVDSLRKNGKTADRAERPAVWFPCYGEAQASLAKRCGFSRVPDDLPERVVKQAGVQPAFGDS